MKNYKNDTFANRLKKALQIRDMKQIELAEKLGLDRSMITKYINGENGTTNNRLDDIANILNVNPSWLMGYDVPMNLSKSNVEKVTYKENDLIKMPVIGTIPAGTPIEAIQYIDDNDYLYVPKERLKGEISNYFLLRISGNSMNPKYLNGDVILFNINPSPDSGSEVAIMVNGDDATFKQIYIEESGIRIHPYNSMYPDATYTAEEVRELPIRVLGVAQSLEYRDLRR